MDRILIICRNVDSLRFVKKQLLRSSASTIIIASDDLKVHAAGQGMHGVEEVVFLEKMESFYSVSSNVLLILDAVNAWLSRFGNQNEIPKELLYWICHCEGGDTTQRIQDALLLVNSYLNLIQLLYPTKIVIVRSDASVYWEDELLAACSKSSGIILQFIGSFRWRRWVNRLWAHWRPLAKEVYFSFSVLMAKIYSMTSARFVFDLNKLVIVQLCSPEKKHINQCLPLIEALEQKGLQGVALCWGVGKAVRRMRQSGQKLVELESWVGIRTLLDSWRRSYKTWSRVYENLDSFLTEDTGCLYTDLIRGVLKKSIRSFFLGEIAHRYRLYIASRKFFTANPPRAIRFWTRVLPQGVTAYRALPPNSSSVLFWQASWDYMIQWPYNHYNVPVDLVFALNNEHGEKLVEAYAASVEQIVFAGFSWLTKIKSFQERYTKRDSRAMLKIRSETKLCVLFDSCHVLRGYWTLNEQSLLLTAILELAKNYLDLHVIVKPHPGHKSGMLEGLLSAYPLNNLTVVPQHDLPYHALNAADILITKMSTLGIEGMILGVPTISVLLDGEKKWMCFEKAAEYIFSILELKRLMIQLLNDTDFYQIWRQKLHLSATEYLMRHSSAYNVDPNEIIATVLEQKLLC